jgi:hypothetical protein
MPPKGKKKTTRGATLPAESIIHITGDDRWTMSPSGTILIVNGGDGGGEVEFAMVLDVGVLLKVKGFKRKGGFSGGAGFVEGVIMVEGVGHTVRYFKVENAVAVDGTSHQDFVVPQDGGFTAKSAPECAGL